MMNFKVPYTEWIDFNGGISSAISNTTEDDLITESITARMLKRGHVYRFKYRDEDKMRKMIRRESTFPYYDMHPIMISLGLENDTLLETGVNLNVLPYQTKYKLFHNIYRILDKFMVDELSQPYKMWKPWPIDIAKFEQIYKLPSKVAINKYERRFMRDLEAVDWGSAIKLSTFYEKDSLLFNKAQNMTLTKLLKMSL